MEECGVGLICYCGDEGFREGAGGAEGFLEAGVRRFFVEIFGRGCLGVGLGK